MPTDEELQDWIEGLKAGREEAFQAFISHYWPSIGRVVSRFTFSGADEEEWIELILLHVFDQIVRGRFEYHSAATFHSWLFCTAGRKCIEFWRRINRSREHAVAGEKLEANPDPKAETPVNRMERMELQDIILDAINHIQKSMLRETIHLTWNEGLSVEEIALKLGRSVNTIRTWQRRGKIALRSILERKHPEIVDEFGGT